MATSNIFADTWRSFWHSITTNDRHASHNSPYRTGSHVPLSQSRSAPLSSVATSALESRVDLNPSASTDALRDYSKPTNGHMSPSSPYSPGMRSALRRTSTDRMSNRSSADKTGVAAEIQMQSFDDGLPPPPPVGHSWKRIERWVESNYNELYDNLCEGATSNDVNELEHELDCSLPVDVRESLQVHDGQERGGRPTGVLFGCMLLDCEEIVEEWRNWRKVNDQYLAKQPHRDVVVQLPLKAFAGPSGSSDTHIPVSQPKQANTLWRDELLEKQDSQPPNAVQKAYAHPGWIPLAKDWGGNCLAVDLAPAPLGKWGQIIIFGRDYDCKFVVARSWAHFLAAVADDFGTPEKIYVDEDSSELKFLQFLGQGVEPPYLEVLRWRCDQRYGRRPPPPRRRSAPSSVSGSMSGLRINAGVGGPSFESMSAGSPYASPISERGRSPQRFNSKPLPKPMTNHSPRRQVLSSPLARVTEEGSSPPIAPQTHVMTKCSPPSSLKQEILHSPDKEEPPLLDRPIEESANALGLSMDSTGQEAGVAVTSAAHQQDRQSQINSVPSTEDPRASIETASSTIVSAKENLPITPQTSEEGDRKDQSAIGSDKVQEKAMNGDLSTDVSAMSDEMKTIEL